MVRLGGEGCSAEASGSTTSVRVIAASSKRLIEGMSPIP